jgi:hypothetical protein
MSVALRYVLSRLHCGGLHRFVVTLLHSHKGRVLGEYTTPAITPAVERQNERGRERGKSAASLAFANPP